MDTKNETLIAIIDMIANIGKSESDSDAESNMEIEVKCTDGGEEKIAVTGSKALIVVQNDEGNNTIVFGDMSVMDIKSMMLAMVKQVEEIDGYKTTGEKMIDDIVEAVLLKRLLGTKKKGE